MRIIQRLILTLCILVQAHALSADGLVAVKSLHSSKDTMDRFEMVVKQKGMAIFAKIDHAAGAAKIGKTIRPTEVLIFGNPQGGTPFIECNQTVGIDLPLKALVWEDASGQVWLGYNDPLFLATRHGVSQCPAAQNMQKVLAEMVKETVGR